MWIIYNSYCYINFICFAYYFWIKFFIMWCVRIKLPETFKTNVVERVSWYSDSESNLLNKIFLILNITAIQCKIIYSLIWGTIHNKLWNLIGCLLNSKHSCINKSITYALINSGRIINNYLNQIISNETQNV